MNHDLHMMVEDQRHREHIREADAHRHAKERRQSRGQVSAWQGIRRKLSDWIAPDMPPTPRSVCSGASCEPAISESM